MGSVQAAFICLILGVGSTRMDFSYVSIYNENLSVYPSRLVQSASRFGKYNSIGRIRPAAIRGIFGAPELCFDQLCAKTKIKPKVQLGDYLFKMGKFISPSPLLKFNSKLFLSIEVSLVMSGKFAVLR